MTFKPPKRPLMMALIASSILVGVALAVILATSNPDWRPACGVLWQKHNWRVPGGALGMEEWRLEGINTDTMIYAGSFYFTTSLPAPMVAVISIGSLCALSFICFALWRTIFSARL